MHAPAGRTWTVRVHVSVPGRIVSGMALTNDDIVHLIADTPIQIGGNLDRANGCTELL
jgi:hypothetical protein